jgi:hypothetical protein
MIGAKVTNTDKSQPIWNQLRDPGHLPCSFDPSTLMYEIFVADEMVSMSTDVPVVPWRCHCDWHSHFTNNYLQMKTNMGTSDRVIRIAIALVFAVLYFTQTVTGTLGFVLLALGGIFVLTSAISFCPLYSLFGFTTCPAKKP